jgi:hypothetical protein
LSGIDEETDDQKIPPFSPLPHEAEVAFMEVPHRGNEGDRLPGPSGSGRKFFHLFDRSDNFHFLQTGIDYLERSEKLRWALFRDF